MSIGLVALLNNITGLAKVAAASLDDLAAQAAKAGAKAAGVVIDDAAVTPRYVVGVAARRELPVIGKIAAGVASQQNLFSTSGGPCPEPIRALGDHATAHDRRSLPLLRGNGESV